MVPPCVLFRQPTHQALLGYSSSDGSDSDTDRQNPEGSEQAQASARAMPASHAQAHEGAEHANKASSTRVSRSGSTLLSARLMASLKGQHDQDMEEDIQRALDQNNYPWSQARFMRVLDKGTRRTITTPDKGEATLIYFGGMEVSASVHPCLQPPTFI